MSQATRMPAVRRFGMGLVWGAATMTGIAVTADSSGWYAIGAGAITGFSYLAWISRVRFRLARIEHERRAGLSTADRSSRVFGSTTIPEAIRTTRFVTAGADNDGVRAQYDPVIAEVDVLVPDGPGGMPFRTTTARTVPFNALSTLQQPTTFTLLGTDTPGAMLLGENDPERHDDVPDPRDVGTGDRLPGVRREIGRGRSATIAMCVGFALSVSTAAVALPDMGFVQEGIEHVVSLTSGGDVADLGDEFQDALDDLQEVRPQSVDLLRSFELSAGSWTLTALDQDEGRDFTITSYESEPSYLEAGHVAGTFSVDRDDLPKLNAMYYDLIEHVDEDDVRGAVVGMPENGGEPRVVYEISTVDAVDEIQGTLDGHLAPVVDPQDVDASLTHLHSALGELGISADEPIFQFLMIRSSSHWAPNPGPPSFLESGGIGGQIVVPSGDYEGENTLQLEVGTFPLVNQGAPFTEPEAATFAATAVSAGQISDIVDDAVADLDAEAGDLLEMTIEVTQPSYGPTVPVVEVTFSNKEPDSYCAEITGSPSNYC